MIILIARRWGWQDLSVTKFQRQGFARAASNQIAYEYGFKKIKGIQSTKWNQQVEQSILKGSPCKVNPLSSLHAGSKKYVEIIEKPNEGYIRYLFRYAQGSRAQKQLTRN